MLVGGELGLLGRNEAAVVTVSEILCEELWQVR